MQRTITVGNVPHGYFQEKKPTSNSKNKEKLSLSSSKTLYAKNKKIIRFSVLNKYLRFGCGNSLCIKNLMNGSVRFIPHTSYEQRIYC